MSAVYVPLISPRRARASGRIRRAAATAACALLLAFAPAGCRNSPPVQRQQEIVRFQDEMHRRTQELKINPAVPLTMNQAVDLALANSLDIRVRELLLKLQDDRVKLSLESGLPKASLGYQDVERSNEPAMKLEGMPSVPGQPNTFAFEDRHQQALTIQGMLPVLDFGLTYYSYQIALDRRTQEQYLLERTKQLLVRDVRVAYAEAAAAQRQERLATVAYDATQQVLRVARSLENADMTVHADTALVESAVAQAGLVLSLAKRRVQETHMLLLQFMSLPPGVEFSIIEEAPPLPPPPSMPQVADFEESALVRRPELAVQDLERHISANAIHREFSQFFPHVDLVGNFNWSNSSSMVNPAFFLYGFRVTHSLFDGGATFWRYDLAKKAATVEEARTLLLSLGVLYEVDLRALRVQQSYETVGAARALESARREALNRVVSLYKEGMEDEAGAARALADLTTQATVLDRAQTDYQVAWYELESASLPASPPTTRPTTQPSTQPTTQQVELPSFRELGL